MAEQGNADGVSLSLAGKVALVTGGSRGIGAATVRLMRQAGARVVFSYKSASRQAEELVAECGGEAFCHAMKQELATVEDGLALVEAAVACFGKLDCVVVNHGVWPPHDQPLADMSVAQWKSTMGVNLDSVFGVVKGGVAQMQGLGIREQGLGKGQGARAQGPACATLMAALMVCGITAKAQDIQLGDGAAATRAHVVALSDGVEVQAGKAQDVELRFRVDAGYHINSHTPKDEYLIPTVLKLDAGAVKVLGEAYPQGSSFTLANGGGTLDVYQGEFRVRVRVLAAKGFSTMTGVLRYQACDNAACFPPKSLPVKVAVTGK